VAVGITFQNTGAPTTGGSAEGASRLVGSLEKDRGCGSGNGGTAIKNAAEGIFGLVSDVTVVEF